MQLPLRVSRSFEPCALAAKEGERALHFGRAKHNYGHLAVRGSARQVPQSNSYMQLKLVTAARARTRARTPFHTGGYVGTTCSCKAVRDRCRALHAALHVTRSVDPSLLVAMPRFACASTAMDAAAVRRFAFLHQPRFENCSLQVRFISDMTLRLSSSASSTDAEGAGRAQSLQQSLTAGST